MVNIKINSFKKSVLFSLFILSVFSVLTYSSAFAATWTERTSPGQHYWYSITSSSDGTKLAAAVQGGYIYTSTDSGATWTERTSAGSRYWDSITSSADGTKLAAAGYQTYVYISTDSGATWATSTASGLRDWNNIASSADGTRLVAVDENSSGSGYGYIYTSTDSGATWTEETSAGARSWHAVTSSSDGTKLAAADNDNANTGYGYIYTGLQSFPDATAPSLVSFTSTTANGTYGLGETINITANFDEEISATSTMTVVLDTGVSVVLDVASSSALSGTYTVASGNASSDLTVSSITSASVADLLANNSTTYSVPSAPNNIADTKEIVVSAPVPTTPAVVTGGMVPLFFLTNQTICNDPQAFNYHASQVCTYATQPSTLVTPPPTPTQSSHFIFTHNLSLMMKHPDVKELQKYLNSQGFTVAKVGAGSPGNETDRFGRLTYLALIAFQNAHAQEILKPSLLTKGTGYFGPSTRGWVNGEKV